MILINSSPKNASKIFQPFLPVFVPIGIGYLLSALYKEGVKTWFIKDFYGSNYSCIFDAELTKTMDSRLMKIMDWYDNEWAYSLRVVDLCEYMVKKGL
jgi:glyceraldehyde-3-phosphate dehydrogenase/erythrose-4-phosphate dehydrogenase